MSEVRNHNTQQHATQHSTQKHSTQGHCNHHRPASYHHGSIWNRGCNHGNYGYRPMFGFAYPPPPMAYGYPAYPPPPFGPRPAHRHHHNRHPFITNALGFMGACRLGITGYIGGTLLGRGISNFLNRRRK